MSTAAQAAANQANARLSTGPKSQTGKAASSQNNFRHGFAGAHFQVLDWEKQSEFAALLEQFAAEHQPATAYESVLVEKLTQHFWLAQRALTLQERCFAPDVDAREAERKLALYLRYQTTHERAFRQLTAELRSSRHEKRQQQIGFESQNAQAADQLRKQEMHEAKLRLLHSKADHIEVDNDIRQTIEAPLPGHLRIPFDTMKEVFSSAVHQVNRERQAAEAA